MNNMLVAQSTCAADTTTGGTGAGAGIGTAMSEVHRLPSLPQGDSGSMAYHFDVVRNSRSQRSNSERLRTFLVLYTPLEVMISIS